MRRAAFGRRRRSPATRAIGSPKQPYDASGRKSLAPKGIGDAHMISRTCNSVIGTASLLFVVMLLGACTPATSATGVDESGRTVTLRDGQFGHTYAGFFFGVGDDYQRDYFDVVGRVSLGDTGFTTIGCGVNDIIPFFIGEARRTGATSFQVLRITPPDFFSTCWRGEAALLIRNDTPWPGATLVEADAREYLDENRDDLDPLEGIWVSQDARSRFLIAQSDGEGLGAWQLESRDRLWQPGMVRAEIQITAASAYPAVVWDERLDGHSTVIALDASGQSFTYTVMVNEGVDRPNWVSRTMTYFRQYPVSSPVATAAEVPSSERRTVTAYGSGFLVASRGLVGTAAHVVRDAESIRAAVGGREYEARVIAVDSANDVAIVELMGFEGSASVARLGSDGSLRLGDRVATLGFPLAARIGESASYTEGTISSLSAGFIDDARFVQVSAPIQPGNSGGPLLNEHGDVVAVVMATLDPLWAIENRGSIPQNVNYAVRITYLETLARSRGIALDVTSVRDSESLTGTALAAVGEAIAVQLQTEKAVAH